MDEFSTLLQTAMDSTSDNKLRVSATIHAYYEYIARDSQAFRLIFESDVLNDEVISERIESFNAKFALGIAEIIAEDTKLPPAQALLMGRAMAGMAQVSARYWVDLSEEVSMEEASKLVSRLAWRGIGRFPKESEVSSEQKFLGATGHRCTQKPGRPPWTFALEFRMLPARS